MYLQTCPKHESHRRRALDLLQEEIADGARGADQSRSALEAAPVSTMTSTLWSSWSWLLI
jgi:hypothetical protein